MDQLSDDIAQRLRDRLAEDGRVSLLDVDVAVRGRNVFLGGSVPTTERRDAAGEVAREALPGYVIHNRITVTSLVEGGDGEPVG